jgi:CheY-like chemotaxis protein
MNLLILDDDELFGYLVSELLTAMEPLKKFYVHLEKDGDSALNYLEQRQNEGSFPDLILIDCKMPTMNGFDFIERYEQTFLPHFPTTRLFMCSSSMRNADKSKALSYKSVSDYISKPMTEEKLLGLLAGFT